MHAVSTNQVADILRFSDKNSKTSKKFFIKLTLNILSNNSVLSSNSLNILSSNFIVELEQVNVCLVEVHDTTTDHIFLLHSQIFRIAMPVRNYMFKVNNRNFITRCERTVLVSLLLTLSIFLT